MQIQRGKLTSKGQLVIPAGLRRKLGIETGTEFLFLEDEVGRIVLQPVTEDSIDRMMGCLADGPNFLANWEREHREEDKPGK
jgi:AbrB family looped-hinge helix DNA binding protein